MYTYRLYQSPQLRARGPDVPFVLPSAAASAATTASTADHLGRRLDLLGHRRRLCRRRDRSREKILLCQILQPSCFLFFSLVRVCVRSKRNEKVKKSEKKKLETNETNEKALRARRILREYTQHVFFKKLHVIQTNAREY